MAQITVTEGQPTFKPIQITHTIESADELATYLWMYAALLNPNGALAPDVVKWMGVEEDYFDGRYLELPNGDPILFDTQAVNAQEILSTFMDDQTWVMLARRLIAERSAK